MILLLVLSLSFTSGFRLSPDDLKYPFIYTHDKITQEGVFRAVQKFIAKYQLINDTNGSPKAVIDRYFGTDLDGYKRFQGVIDGFIQVFGVVKSDPRAFIHVYCEQILMAHEHIVRLKNDIQHHASGQQLSSNMIEIIRQKIAHALYTLQNFYSNTNWIEIKGNKVYEDFGRPGWQLMNIADSTTDTCCNCNTGFCEDNLLKNNTLTSGYISGVDVAKPFRESDAKTGKCSHGGSQDKTRNTVAKGGINKETNDQSESPHYQLHGPAAMAAIRATEAFFVSSETGLLNILGKENFKKILEIHSTANAVHTSLAFNIDTTGSMSDEISAVMTTTLDMVTRVMDSVNKPADYVLTTFNDPADKTTGFTTTDGAIMMRKLEALRAHGGGDCPEYLMSGLNRAIELSRNNSHIYTFTDADAKDMDLWNTVLHNAKAKDIHLGFILTGNCSSSTKRSVHQSGQEEDHISKDESVQRRSGGFLTFQDLASQTNGSTYMALKEELLDGTLSNKLLGDIEKSSANPSQAFG